MPLCLIESPLLQPRPGEGRERFSSRCSIGFEKGGLSKVALNVTPYRKIMPMAVARVCTRSIPGRRNVTVCRLRKTRIYIYIRTRSGCRFGEIKKGVEGLLVSSQLKVDSNGRIIQMKSCFERIIPALFLPIIGGKERRTYYECTFFLSADYASLERL